MSKPLSCQAIAWASEVGTPLRAAIAAIWSPDTRPALATGVLAAAGAVRAGVVVAAVAVVGAAVAGAAVAVDPEPPPAGSESARPAGRIAPIVRPLLAASWATETPWRAAIALSVSPVRTR